jgi:hypothetical protein
MLLPLLASFCIINPINETYIEISTLNNVTIMPQDATAGTTINATETANATLNILFRYF